MKIICIVQARMGSNRLPDKVLLDLAGKTMLERVVDRVKAIERLDSIVIATTTDPEDERIEREAKRSVRKHRFVIQRCSSSRHL